MSAAEPIRPATVSAFFDAFEVTGLKREVFYPAYGLAEHTVSVTMGGKATTRFDQEALGRGQVVALDAASSRSAITLVGCGRVTKPDARVRIVNPETHVPCAPNETGEVWVHSATKALGYYGMEKETKELFHAVVKGDDDKTEYLRTGDIGFFYEDELYIAGRCKDLIIIRGRNIYPQDLEDSVRDCHAVIRPGGVVAFSTGEADGKAAMERVVLLVELRDGPVDAATKQAVVTAVRRRLTEAHQLTCHTVVLGKRGLVLKTTSGKVRRRSCKQAFLSGALETSEKTICVDRLEMESAECV